MTELSDWTKLNYNIRVVDTTKKFYQKYLYKVTFGIPGVYLLTRSSFEHLKVIDDYELAREKTATNIRTEKAIFSVRTVYDSRRGKLDQVKVGDLMKAAQMLISVRQNTFTFRPRIEGWSLDVYGVNEEDLLRLTLDSKLGDKVIMITRPKTQEIADILLNNKVIISAVTPEYKYKVMIREGRHAKATRVSVMNYLETLGDQVKLTKSTVDGLQRSRDYMGGCYFYVNDHRIVDFVRLMAPNMIADIFELKYIPAK